MDNASETAEARRVVMSLYEHWITDPPRVEPLLHDDFKMWHRADPRHTPRAAEAMDKATYMAGLNLVQDSLTQPDGSRGMKITIVEVIAEGNKVMVEIEAEGISAIKPDYMVHNHGVGIYEVVDGQIISVRAYEDTAMMNYLFGGAESTGDEPYHDPFIRTASDA